MNLSPSKTRQRMGTGSQKQGCCRESLYLGQLIIHAILMIALHPVQLVNCRRAAYWCAHTYGIPRSRQLQSALLSGME